MKPSLSVLLPVHNAQAMLQAGVQRLLEVLPELTGRFEVLIVDDGSTDATCEIAYELARAYPQVKVTRQATSLGWAAAVANQARQANGEFLIIHCGGTVEADDIASLWRLRHNMTTAAAAKAKSEQGGKSWRVDPESTVAGRQPAGKVQVTTLFDGLCIHARAPKSNFLMLGHRQLDRLEHSLAAIPRSNWFEAPAAKRSSSSRNTKRSQGIKPPSFLNQLKTFTLGE